MFGIYERNGMVYTEIVPDCSKLTLQSIIRGKVAPESMINSDGWRGTWPEMTSIAQRPPEAERSSRYLPLVQVASRQAPVVRQAFTRQMQGIPPMLRHALTYDRGKEMAQHKALEAEIPAQRHRPVTLQPRKPQCYRPQP